MRICETSRSKTFTEKNIHELWRYFFITSQENRWGYASEKQIFPKYLHFSDSNSKTLKNWMQNVTCITWNGPAGMTLPELHGKCKILPVKEWLQLHNYTGTQTTQNNNKKGNKVMLPELHGKCKILPVKERLQLHNNHPHIYIQYITHPTMVTIVKRGDSSNLSNISFLKSLSHYT